MELPFIYKYQPVFLDDFEINVEIIVLIRTLISMDSLNVLFVGDAGCGKSSLISAITREYYQSNENEDNMLFISNLKDNGISYYRNEVKTFCQTATCLSGKKKIVVLDDLDNMNEQCQQVIRNCMDKYSDNVHFLSSCTNIQKVIETLQSRVTIIRITAMETESLRKIVKRICKIENIVIDPDTEEFILTISNNSVRIIVNYLEKFKLLSERITLELAASVCTNISFQDFAKFTTLCKESQLHDAIDLMYNIFDDGYSVMDILDNFFLFIKITPLLNDADKYTVITLICKYITAFNMIHEDEIEIAIFTSNLVEILGNSSIY